MNCNGVKLEPAIFRSPLRLFGKGGRPEREKLILSCGGIASGPSFLGQGTFWEPSVELPFLGLSSHRSAAGGDFSSCVYLTPPHPSLFLTRQSSSVPIRDLSIQDASPTGRPASWPLRQNHPSCLLSRLQRLCQRPEDSTG